MSSKDWFNDYMDYKLSGGEDDEEKAIETGGCLPWVLGVLIVFWIISKLLG